MKLTFRAEYTPEEEQLRSLGSKSYEPVFPKIVMEFEANTLDAIYIQFRDFLLGCGFFIKGEIGELEK